jgi:hypothetical protein
MRARLRVCLSIPWPAAYTLSKTLPNPDSSVSSSRQWLQVGNNHSDHAAVGSQVSAHAADSVRCGHPAMPQTACAAAIRFCRR